MTVIITSTLIVGAMLGGAFAVALYANRTDGLRRQIDDLTATATADLPSRVDTPSVEVTITGLDTVTGGVSRRHRRPHWLARLTSL